MSPVVLLVNLVPASVGVDTQLRVPVGWPMQIPLSWREIERAGDRIVVTPRVVPWTDRPLTTFDIRLGYRRSFVAARTREPGGTRQRVVPFVGMGAMMEFAPVLRPLLSPEVGLQFRSGGHLGAINLGLQGDVGVPSRSAATAPAVRGTFMLGWSVL